MPFATNPLARLSPLSAWWVRLGILPELIEPGNPQQNGRHERMHRTLKAETTRPPAANCCAHQRQFNHFREEFNTERPHEALDLHTPASVYAPSPRAMPDRLPPLEVPDRFETRYVSANGGIRWNAQWVNVSMTCVGEYVGLEEIDDGIWNVYFGPLTLGRLLETHMRIEDAFGRLKRHLSPMSPDFFVTHVPDCSHSICCPYSGFVREYVSSLGVSPRIVTRTPAYSRVGLFVKSCLNCVSCGGKT